MNIFGLQRLTLLDYPEHTACTVFTSGCNLNCPFCHNSELIHTNKQVYTEEYVLDFLLTRKNILDGVCITGGEPTLQPDLEYFIISIRNLGFKIKLDTNGTNPDCLIDLCEKGLLDYVAMDIKNCKQKYEQTCGTKNIDMNSIEQSVEYLMNSKKVDYEFRTTVVKNLHTNSDIKNIAKWINGCNKYFLQKYVLSQNVLDKKCEPVSDEDMKQLLLTAQNHIGDCIVKLRGVAM